jgi:beta-phosphoglucomutase-like phosphatase (HAD superfamily)
LTAGDDVKLKKPDPSIYVTAAKVVSTTEADII